MSPAAEPDLDTETEAEVLADLRRARRRRRTASIDPFEALYRAYVTAVLVGVAFWLLSGVVGGTRLGAGAAAGVAAHGPQAVGLAVGLAVAVGLRSGGRGGPLVIEAADVRHVLLAPVDRVVALRGPALRQVRFAAAAALAAGALVGLLAFRRLPGDPVLWVLCGAATAAVAVVGAFGAALVASGARIGSRVGSLLALAVVGWSAADLVTGMTTSPATLLAEVSLWPLRFRPEALAGAAVMVALAAGGLALVGRCSIEAAERRATLVGQIRFAATLRDLRTVVVLRRQLAQELPRQRPWLRLPRSVTVGGSHHRRWWPVWRRGWHGILRFPALRLGRMALLGAAAGAAGVGVWHGITPLVFAAALALYVAALDAVEPVAQELDHPDRTDAYPEETGVLYMRQVGPPVVVMLLVGLVGVGAAVAVSGGRLLALNVGLADLVPAVLCATGAAMISVIQGPPPVFSSTDTMMPPEMAGIRALLRTAVPPAVATVGILPLLAGRHPAKGIGPVNATVSVAPEVIVLVALVAAWVRYRERVGASWRASMEEAKSARSAAR
jgi:hypothetical protein